MVIYVALLLGYALLHYLVSVKVTVLDVELVTEFVFKTLLYLLLKGLLHLLLNLLMYLLHRQRHQGLGYIAKMEQLN